MASAISDPEEDEEERRDDVALSFVPDDVVQRYVLAGDDGAPDAAAGEEREAQGAALFVDAVGFTALSEQRTPEELALVINRLFGRLITTVHAHGGDVVKFLGDALLCTFLGPPEQAALQAVACAGALHSDPPPASSLSEGGKLKGENRRGSDPWSFSLARWRASAGSDPAAAAALASLPTLPVKVGVGAGRLVSAHVGGYGGRWEFLTMGPAVDASLAAAAAAAPGQTLLAPSVFHLLPAGACRELRAASPRARRRVRAALEAYVTAPQVLRRLYQGQSELLLAENRTVSVLFLSLHGLEKRKAGAERRRLPALPGAVEAEAAGAGAGPLVASLHAAVRIVQGVLAEQEGALRQVAADDKGRVILAAFGIPGAAHGYADDAARAVEAALQAQRLLGGESMECAAGVATGRVFCGLVGDTSAVLRAEYACIGSVVNKAARLMAAAKKAREVLVDEATFAATDARFAYRAAPPLALKGYSEPVKAPLPAPLPPERRGAARHDARAQAYRPSARAAEGSGRSRAPEAAPRRAPAGVLPLRGRERELAEALEALKEAAEAGASCAISVHAEAGMGKSRFVAEVARSAEAAGFRVALGAASVVERSAPYLQWCSALHALFAPGGGEAATNPETPKARGARPSPPSSDANRPPRQQAAEGSGPSPATRNPSFRGGSFRAKSFLRSFRAAADGAGAPGSPRREPGSSRRRLEPLASQHDPPPDLRPLTFVAPEAQVRLQSLDRRPSSSFADEEPGGRGRAGGAGGAGPRPPPPALVPPPRPSSSARLRLAAEARAQATADVLAGLLGALPTLVVLEDCHWADPSSAALTAALARAGVPRLCLLTTARPEPGGAPARAPLARPRPAGLPAGPRRLHIELKPLTRESAAQQVGDRLGAGVSGRRMTVGESALVDFLYDRAQGRPLFTEELMNMLTETGALREEGPDWRFDSARTNGAAPSASLPDSVQGVIVARIDRLGASPELTLKVASVLGRRFQAGELWAVYPIPITGRAFLRDLRELVRTDFLVEAAPPGPDDSLETGTEGGAEEEAPAGAFAFKHQLVVDVAYRLLLRSQAAAVHLRVGELLEEQHGGARGRRRTGTPPLPLLAHHFDAAGDVPRAVEYLSRAAEAAARLHAHSEVLALASRALERAPPGLAGGARGRLEMLRGEACHGAGRSAALAALGRPLPASKGGMVRAILRQLLAQVAHRALPPLFGGRCAGDRDAQTAVRCYGALSSIAFLGRDRLAYTLSITCALNLAELLHSHAELARCCIHVAVACVALGRPGLAGSFYRRAHAAMDAAGWERNPQGACDLCFFSSAVKYNYGEWEEARRLGERGLALARQVASARRVCEFENGLAVIAVLTGRLADGAARYLAVFQAASERNDPYFRGWSAGMLADICTMMGDVDGFLRYLRPFQEAAAGGHLDIFPGMVAHAHVSTGEERLARGDAAGAAAALTVRAAPVGPPLPPSGVRRPTGAPGRGAAQEALRVLGPVKKRVTFGYQQALTMIHLALRLWVLARAAGEAGGERAARARLLDAEGHLARYAAAIPSAPDAGVPAGRGPAPRRPPPPPPPPASSGAARAAARLFARAAAGARQMGLRCIQGLSLSALGAVAGDAAAAAEGAALLAEAGMLPGWCPLFPPSENPIAPLGARDASGAGSGADRPHVRSVDVVHAGQ
eukprot:tig00021127_g18816.t1